MKQFPDWAQDWFLKREYQFSLKGGKISDTDKNLVNDWLHSFPEERPKMIKKLYKLNWEDAMIAQEKWHHELFLKMEKQKKNKEAFKGDSDDFLEISKINGNKIEKTGIWKWGQIKTKEGLDYEGNAMGHCIGKGGYDRNIQTDLIRIYSLRDENNFPHVTVEYNVEKKRIDQIQGRGNKMVSSKYYNGLLELMRNIKPHYINVEMLLYFVQVNEEWFTVDMNKIFNFVNKLSLDDELIIHGSLNMGVINIQNLPNKTKIFGNIIIQEKDLSTLIQKKDITSERIFIERFLPINEIVHHKELCYDNGEKWVKKQSVYINNFNSNDKIIFENCFESDNFQSDFVIYTYVSKDNVPILRFKWEPGKKRLQQLVSGWNTIRQADAICDLIRYLNPVVVDDVRTYLFYKKENDNKIFYNTLEDIRSNITQYSGCTIYGHMKITHPVQMDNIVFAGDLYLKKQNLNYISNIQTYGDLTLKYCSGTIDVNNVFKNGTRNISFFKCNDIEEINGLYANQIDFEECNKIKKIIHCMGNYISIYYCDNLIQVDVDFENRTSIINCKKLNNISDIISEKILLSCLDIKQIGFLKGNTIDIKHSVIRYGEDFNEPENLLYTNTKKIKRKKKNGIIPFFTEVYYLYMKKYSLPDRSEYREERQNFN